MEKLTEMLHQGNFSCVIANKGDIRTFRQRGVADLYDLLNHEPHYLDGAIVADKVIGKGAAALMIKGGVKEVYADLISESALNLFQLSGINIKYSEWVNHIENRDKTDWCPLEKSCKETHSIAEIMLIIDAFISKIRGKQIECQEK